MYWQCEADVPIVYVVNHLIYLRISSDEIIQRFRIYKWSVNCFFCLNSGIDLQRRFYHKKNCECVRFAYMFSLWVHCTLHFASKSTMFKPQPQKLNLCCFFFCVCKRSFDCYIRWSWPHTLMTISNVYYSILYNILFSSSILCCNSTTKNVCLINEKKTTRNWYNKQNVSEIM